MVNHALTAAAMSAAALSDPQFRLPTQPRIAPGLVIVPTEGGVLVEGGPSRQLLAGAAASRVFAQLVPLLDGTRTVDDIAHALGDDPGTTHAAISLLYASGLLEDAENEPAIAAPDSPTHQFYARSIDSTRLNHSGAEAVARLQHTRLALAASPQEEALAGHLADEFRRAGIGTVHTDANDADLVVTIGDDPAVRIHAAHAAAHGTPVFPVFRRGRTVYYGPIVDPSYTVTFADLAEQISGEPNGAADANDDLLVAAIVAGDVIALRARVGSPLSKQTLQRFDLDTFTQQPLVAVPSTSDGMPLGYAFEVSTAFPPRHLNAPRDHQVHYKPGNVSLQRESKVWPSAPARELPAPPMRLEEPHPTLGATPTADVLRADVLADIVIRTAGNRTLNFAEGEKVRRWAPTGGNLGSVQAYVIARNVSGLEPGVYGYQRGDNSLAELSWADPETTIAGADPHADAVIILTGNIPRVASKYMAFAWRIVHLDAGVATTQARMLAAGHRLGATLAPAWDDETLIDLLAIEPDGEPITAVISLTTRTTEGAPQ